MTYKWKTSVADRNLNEKSYVLQEYNEGSYLRSIVTITEIKSNEHTVRYFVHHYCGPFTRMDNLWWNARIPVSLVSLRTLKRKLTKYVKEIYEK